MGLIEHHIEAQREPVKPPKKLYLVERVDDEGRPFHNPDDDIPLVIEETAVSPIQAENFARFRYYGCIPKDVIMTRFGHGFRAKAVDTILPTPVPQPEESIPPRSVKCEQLDLLASEYENYLLGP